ncbi:glycoside hydrolase family 25 protein [Bizionia paragorgiae]|uniref:Lysozyme n=1 Tax=Bizionia paragorgiae TaxID=283786 RepID=A0A1H3WJU8_BIZPA|nr:GH25 family lysozyme [Bizionia paragorgiae]SDZ86674.1 lysozyme [Bizionia paragorgiae]
MKTKRIIIIAFILLLAGVLMFTKKHEIYQYGKHVLKSYNGNKTKSIKNSDAVWGIDISHHQKSIDWDVLVSENKPDFIFLKSTEGVTHQDSKYKAYKKKAQQKGILTGAYHFFSYSTPGKAQAENFIKHSELTESDLIPVLDVEYIKSRKSYKSKVGEIKAFCEAIKAEYGMFPIIYCECDYKNKVLGSDFDTYTFWISDLYKSPSCDYAFWQYTDSGRVNGIGRIDNNKLRDGLNINDYLIGSAKK